MSYENGEFCQQDDDNNQQDLEEAHFYQTVSTFEELLVTHDPNLVVWSLSQASVDKLEKALSNLVPF